METRRFIPLLPEHRLRKPPLEHPRYRHIKNNGRENADDSINQVMRLNIHGSTAQQQIERKQTISQLMADSPCHNHHNGGNSNMRTRKSRSGTLSYLLGGLNQIIEKTVFVARTGKQKSMMVEIITDRGKNSGAYIIHSDDREIELRTGYRHK